MSFYIKSTATFFIFLLTLVVSFSLTVQSATAATYYIDNSRSNNTGDGLSPATAWKDLYKAGSAPVTSGDTILLRRGQTWTGSTLTVASGTTIGTYDSGDDPVINANSAVIRGIYINGGSNVTVSDIVVSGATGAHVQVNNSTNVILNDITTSGAPTAFRFDSSTVTCNTCETTNAGGFGGFYLTGTTVATINDGSSIGTTASSGFNQINSATLTCNDCVSGDSYEDGFSANNTGTLTCNRCSAYDNGNTGTASSGDGYTAHDTSTLNVRNSIAYGNMKSGVAVTGGSSGEIYHSTFYNNVEATNGNSWSGGDMGIGINSTGTWNIRNNITAGHPLEFFITGTAIAGGVSVTSDYNLFYDSLGGSAFGYNDTFYTFSNFKTASSTDANSVNANPQFTNAGGNDFTLGYLSPAIDAGVTISGFSSDFNGDNYYGVPDIGAQEYQPSNEASTQAFDKGSVARIYSDGQYRNTSATTGTTIDFSVSPEGGFTDSDYTHWMDLTFTTWNTSGNYAKVWSESSDTIDDGVTVHTVGDLQANGKYELKVNGTTGANITSSDCISGICTADGSGQIEFNYTGGYSTVNFSLTAYSPSSGSDSPQTPAPSVPQPKHCTTSISSDTPDLFQINRTGSTATLHFTPIPGGASEYHIVYGYRAGDERFGMLSARAGNTELGVQDMVIRDLDPAVSYWFKVASVNDCAVGTWSNWLKADISKNNNSIFYRYVSKLF